VYYTQASFLVSDPEQRTLSFDLILPSFDSHPSFGVFKPEGTGNTWMGEIYSFHPVPPVSLQVRVNGERVTFDSPPFVESGRSFVPFRAIGEALGAKVDWDGSTQTVTLTLGSRTVVLRVGGRTALVTGQVVALQAPAQLRKDRVFVPLRFVGEALGATVNWDQATNLITVDAVEG